uniref:Uncharacterized protein n=1 Tax=Anguilla anguilla TaxID=7936 RepID=A0A0E9V959_ANGAN
MRYDAVKRCGKCHRVRFHRYSL